MVQQVIEMILSIPKHFIKLCESVFDGLFWLLPKKWRKKAEHYFYVPSCTDCFTLGDALRQGLEDGIEQTNEKQQDITPDIKYDTENHVNYNTVNTIVCVIETINNVVSGFLESVVIIYDEIQNNKRVCYLAHHSKKYRVRKKNIKRLQKIAKRSLRVKQ